MTEQDVRRIVLEELARHLDPEPEIMKVEEVAEFLRLDRNSVYEYTNRGLLPHRRVGRRLLYSRSALIVWLGTCKTASDRKG